MSRIFSTGRDENLENAVCQPLIDLEKVAAKLSGTRMVRTASNKQTNKASSKDRKIIQEAVDRILKSKQEENACTGGGAGVPEGDTMVPAAGKVSVRPRETKASINSFGPKKGGFVMPTAEYLEKCAREGDEESYLKALEIRAQFINAFVKKAEAEEAREVEAARRSRDHWRKVVAENLKTETEEEDDDEDEKDDEDGIPEFLKKKDKKNKEASSKTSFKSVSAMKKNEKEVLASKLMALGYSREAALAYIADAYAPRYSVPAHIKQLAQSNLEKEAKTAIFKGFVREAKLEERDRNHLLDYWANVLGYQDKEWCSDLVKDVDPVTGE